MTRHRRGAMPAVRSADPGGPLVVVCVGRRCSQLRAGGAGRFAALHECVAATRGAVLVTTGCLGGCPRAAVTGVAHRDGATGRVGRTAWLTGVHEPSRAVALVDWLRSGGPAPDGDPDADLPVALIEAVVALGPPPRLPGTRGP